MPNSDLYRALEALHDERRSYCCGYSMIGIETAILIVHLGWARWRQEHHELEITAAGDAAWRDRPSTS